MNEARLYKLPSFEPDSLQYLNQPFGKKYLLVINTYAKPAMIQNSSI